MSTNDQTIRRILHDNGLTVPDNLTEMYDLWLLYIQMQRHQQNLGRNGMSPDTTIERYDLLLRRNAEYRSSDIAKNMTLDSVLKEYHGRERLLYVG